MPLKSFSIHAHFYQPPRDDPLTGEIPIEEGAAPYPNWNERILAECYRPNAELGNFRRISFNLGPTLAGWLETHGQDTFQSIIAQDRANLRQFGVGNAIAQAYNHSILPLDVPHVRRTQVAWGIADFEHHFGRRPQGMWLPETAVNLDTLIALAQHGIEFTILAPWQADDPALDVTEPYRVQLPDGRSIVVFFYHRDLSSGVSFDPRQTMNADQFVYRYLTSHFQSEKEQRGEPQMLLIASDGELYGHHQPLRDRFLAHLVNGATSKLGLSSTYPGLWLRENPVRRTMRIRENTSWSCHHGVGRWSDCCPCTPGESVWKPELRKALDWLAAQLDRQYQEITSTYLLQPWQLRDRYIEVILGNRTLDDLVFNLVGSRVEAERVDQLHWLLEAQRNRMRMFTSCGWFFEDFDRIEPRNNLAYAVQAIRMADKATGVDLSAQMAGKLSQICSSRTGLRGDQVFQQHLQRANPQDSILSGA